MAQVAEASALEDVQDGIRRLGVFRLRRAPVELWSIPTAQGPLGAEAELPPEELAAAGRIGDLHGRAQYLAGRHLLRRVLAPRFGLPAARLPIAVDGEGRPGLALEGADYDFNLSHSGACVVLAVCEGARVGIDLERVRPRGGAAALADRYFSATERDRLAGLARLDGLRPDSDHHSRYLREWYWIWTHREAHTKAIGSGVRDIARDLPPGGSVRIAPRHGYVGTIVVLRGGTESEGRVA